MNRSISRWLFSTLILAIAVSGRAADSSKGREFVGQLSSSERLRIGVDGMTEEQIEALEAAVRRFVSSRSEEASEKVRGALEMEVAKRDAQLSRTNQELEETKEALKERDPVGKESLFQRAKVFLMPGTEIEYTNLESHLARPFKGWRRGTLFQLDNGQIWEVLEGEYVTPEEPPGKAVTIVPGMLGSFFIAIEGVRQRAKVRLVSR